MALTAALGHIWDLIEVVPQPEERLETIYMWVEDWDKMWIHDKCMCDYTKECVMCQNLLVPGAIAIADLWCPVEQRWIHIDDIFKDYQERVELRVQLEVERLTREPSMCMCRQAAMVIDKVDELENNKGDCPPNPDLLKTGALAPEANLPCRECTKRKNTGSGETAAGLSHKWVKSVMPTPPPMDNVGDLGNGGLFGRLMGLLDDPPAPIISAQDESEGPPVEETPLVANLSESTTCEALAECIQLLEGRVDDKEFELTQIHQMLGLLVM
ncbi:hypothetical protein F5J12DRAFT_779170 [Pisolithus orientalis]|uniref:uncharacterized protein n=1 Tax=Pisolithus orientalis TaxID=936130 RepID=UPI0022242119|nr:uncharacterized protein F5J12DRAFT_779170 [Pisolithus orientalis]KAI6032723.1 hypothetical protein F5J12DRAFT_779170 [Pisolithus orientalis]